MWCWGGGGEGVTFTFLSLCLGVSCTEKGVGGVSCVQVPVVCHQPALGSQCGQVSLLWVSGGQVLDVYFPFLCLGVSGSEMRVAAAACGQVLIVGLAVTVRTSACPVGDLRASARRLLPFPLSLSFRR